MAITIEQHIVIDRPVEAVWDYLVNHDEWRKPIVKSVRKISDRPHGEGARYQNKVSMGREMTIINRITAFDPPHKMTWIQENPTAPVYTAEGHYLLEPVEEGRTRFTLKLTSQPVGLWRVLAPVFKLMFARGVAPSLVKKLKQNMEQQGT